MTASLKTETRNGVVPGVAHLALDVVDRGQSTAIALIQDVRTELRQLADSGIELAEKASAAMFRVARKITQRVDEGAAEALTGLERVVGGAVRSARDATRTATELAHTAVGSVAGSPGAQA